MFQKNVILAILGVFVFLTAYLPQQKDFALILSLYSVAFGSYVLLIREVIQIPEKILFSVWGMVALALVFTFPNLSDDIYRFYWDGMIVDQGISPYHHLPIDLVKEGTIQNSSLYEKLNSPEYYSVYPPLNQVFYWVSFKLSSDIILFSLILKIIYLIVVIAGLIFTMKLLPLIGLNRTWSFVFFFNPLVLIEGVGNLHIEIVMVLLLGIGFYYYQVAKKSILLPLFYALSLGVKLVPLLISPLLWFHQPGHWRRRFLIIVSLFTTVLLSPVLIGSGYEGFTDSLDLYFRKFEFNGGIYYILRFIGYQIKGYNLIAYIGPGLALMTLIVIMLMAIKNKRRDIHGFVSLSLIAWTLYLLLSTTVHPWYVIPLIFFGMLSRKWYPIWWSYFIMWTYINYNHADYFENLWVVGLEYSLVLIAMVYEYGLFQKIKSLKE